MMESQQTTESTEQFLTYPENAQEAFSKEQAYFYGALGKIKLLVTESRVYNSDNSVFSVHSDLS